MAKTLNNTMEARKEQCADRIVDIISSNIPRLDSELEKLNRRADKINCPHVRYDILETKMVPDPDALAHIKNYYEYLGMPVPAAKIEALPHIEMISIHIMGEGPKVDGWKFVGTLDHYTIPGKVIVNTVPGESVPGEYFDHAASCDHCEKIRRRVETFVLEGADENEGEWKLVGRSCLRDFFGHDPMYVARFLNRIWKLCDNLENDERWSSGGFGGRVDYSYNAVEVLTTTVAMIRTLGWIAKSSAGYDQTPTSSDVRYALNGPSTSRDMSWENFMSTVQFDNEKDGIEAEAAIEWLKEQEATNEYMHNLKLLEDATHVPGKMLGYWCSLIAAYQRSQDTLERAKKQKRVNAHFGKVGDRVETRVKCIGITSTEGYYGIVNIHRMLTEEGNTLVWFANASRKMEKDNEYVIRARIKDHDEYKDWAQTILSRLFVVEEIAA